MDKKGLNKKKKKRNGIELGQPADGDTVLIEQEKIFRIQPADRIPRDPPEGWKEKTPPLLLLLLSPAPPTTTTFSLFHSLLTIRASSIFDWFYSFAFPSSSFIIHLFFFLFGCERNKTRATAAVDDATDGTWWIYRLMMKTPRWSNMEICIQCYTVALVTSTDG